MAAAPSMTERVAVAATGQSPLVAQVWLLRRCRRCRLAGANMMSLGGLPEPKTTSEVGPSKGGVLLLRLW